MMIVEWPVDKLPESGNQVEVEGEMYLVTKIGKSKPYFNGKGIEVFRNVHLRKLKEPRNDPHRNS